MIETDEYWANEDSFIFKHHFDKSIDLYKNLIMGKKKLIFSNYNLFDLALNIYNFNDYHNKYLFSYYYKKSKFNHPIIFNQDWDWNLKYLVFGYKFNHPVNLPNSLIFLIFGNSFNHQILLPESLEYLELNSFANEQIILPNLKFLSINSDNSFIINNLPNSLETLKLNRNFNLELNDLPSNIINLIFCKYSKYNRPLNNLPCSLENLVLPKNYNEKIKNIPPKLKFIDEF